MLSPFFISIPYVVVGAKDKVSCGFGVDEGNNPVNTVVVVILIVCDRVAEVAVLGTGERFAICQFLRIFVTQNIAAWINGSCVL